MYQRRVGRLPGFPYRGPFRYFLTFCTRNRQEFFQDATIVDECVDGFRRAAAERRFDIVVYCMMPDHAHMLVEGTTDESHLPSFASLAKQYSAYGCRAHVEGRLWQAGYYDHVLRDNETTQKVARYIIENPVRAKIVDSVWDYPFIGSSKYTREQLIEWAYEWS